MSLYSFQLPTTPSPPTYGSLQSPLSTPIPPQSFYCPPPQTRNREIRIYDPPPPTPVPIYSTPETCPTPSQTATSSRRKRQADDTPKENAFQIYTPSASKRRRTALTPSQKIDLVLKCIQDLNWSYSEFLYWSSKWKGVNRSHSHANAVERFLSGRCNHHPGEVIHNWITSPDGRPGTNRDAKDQMWSTAALPHYWEIKNVRASLTSFAAQTSIAHAIKQAKKAVKPSNGLQIRCPKRSESGALKNPVQSYWKDIGVDTVPQVGKIIRHHEPFLFNFLSCIATGKVHNGAVVARKTRPTDIVITHCIASLNFSLNRRANWLPVARGILYFAHSAPVDLFSYESRIGTMPAYSTVYRILRDLGLSEALVTEMAGKDPMQWGKFFIDNVQNFLRQRDMRAGRENKMTIGLAGTYIQYPPGTFDPAALDLTDRQARISKNERAKVTPAKFLDLINHEHLETIGCIQWLECLSTYVPELDHYLPHVAMLYESRAAIHRLKPEPSKIHPLSTNGRDENITAEFYAAILDFFRQGGQTKDNFLHRLWPFGGDGLTYQRLLELQRYLQYNDNDLLSLRILEPQLEWWHTMWTDLCRVYETHWGKPLSKDPSTLGHSSRKIGREDPSNLKKVDYYPSAQLAYLVLDVRMLDCWRLLLKTPDLFVYFRDCKTKNIIPPFEDLEKIARQLYATYSCTRGMSHAMHNADLPEDKLDWTKNVPMGTPWTGLAAEDIGLAPSTKHADDVLANSIAFMRDTLVSRECANAVASGDVGRVWEVLKVMLFTFAGSAHSKYATYLLETITVLEIESSAALRKALLSTMLVNLSGKPGTFAPCDLIQEYFNRLLEAIVERKGKEFDHSFIQSVISRNLHNLARVKTDLRGGVDLEKRAGRHTEPHNNPEVRSLLQLYAHHELHSRRPGRFIEEREVDDFTKGYIKLSKGKMAKWANETTHARVREDVKLRISTLHPTAITTTNTSETSATNTSETSATISLNDGDHLDELEPEDSDSSDGSDSDDEDPSFRNTLGVMQLVDGQLIAQTFDLQLTAEEAMALLEAELREDEQAEEDAEEEEDSSSDSDWYVCFV
ncbi:hypothetical protein DFJ43DRAFT_1006589 [Lentinula guzmanii]|uniref:DUF6589 domain-containing protein n=1 Tax=Lentinula guzmanii TaxID=2804957 RepID=A0AA38J3I9_9AGAR|nr:hypothetical protein DFJ43DRAFT_1006589 [Lentinula guzmanii]